MDAWAIKHLPSGRYLPSPRGRGGRGGTHVEIDDPGMPRLFPSEASARAALRWWLGGTVHVGQTASYSYDFNGYDEGVDEGVDEDWTIKPTPHRKAEDMQVVRVRLTEAEVNPEATRPNHAAAIAKAGSKALLGWLKDNHPGLSDEGRRVLDEAWGGHD